MPEKKKKDRDGSSRVVAERVETSSRLSLEQKVSHGLVEHVHQSQTSDIHAAVTERRQLEVVDSLRTHNDEARMPVIATSPVRANYYFVSAAVAVDSSRMTASTSASWSRFSVPSNVVTGHVSKMWFMVCRWPQSQEGDWARPHLCKLARKGLRPVRKRFIGDHV